MISGSVVDVSHANGSVCHAPGTVRISMAAGVTLVNSPNVEISHEKNGVKISDVKLTGMPTLRKNPLADKFKIQKIVAPDERGGPQVVLDRNGTKLTVKPDTEIVEKKGKAAIRKAPRKQAAADAKAAQGKVASWTPAETEEALAYNLALRLITNYKLPPDPAVAGMARASLNTMRQANYTTQPAQMPMSLRPGTRLKNPMAGFFIPEVSAGVAVTTLG